MAPPLANPAGGGLPAQWLGLHETHGQLWELAEEDSESELELGRVGPRSMIGGPGVRPPKRAEGRHLVWLHDFLKRECQTDVLATCARLGLQRTLDKTTNRYQWVHPSRV